MLAAGAAGILAVRAPPGGALILSGITADEARDGRRRVPRRTRTSTGAAAEDGWCAFSCSLLIGQLGSDSIWGGEP